MTKTMKNIAWFGGIISAGLVFALILVLALTDCCDLRGVVRCLANRLPEVITALATLIGVIIALWTYLWHTKVEVFQKYTEQYREVMSDKTLAKWRLNMDKPYTVRPEEHENLRLALLNYLNLCSEEYSMFKKGWLGRGIWKMWKDDLERTLCTPLLRKEWETLKDEFKTCKKFIKYVRNVQG
ncbi:MAG: hypothetical protein MdMp014T_1759 [Treponematales bacterium]